MKKYNINMYQVPIKKIYRIKQYWSDWLKYRLPIPKKINVVHHATKIIEHDVENNTIKLNNGGWYSKTTKDRMHSYLIENANYRLYQRKGNWFIDQVDKSNDYKTIKTIPYENNMILEVA